MLIFCHTLFHIATVVFMLQTLVCQKTWESRLFLSCFSMRQSCPGQNISLWTPLKTCIFKQEIACTYTTTINFAALGVTSHCSVRHLNPMWGWLNVYNQCVINKLWKCRKTNRFPIVKRRHGGLVVSALVSRLNSLGLSKTLDSSQCLSAPSCINIHRFSPTFNISFIIFFSSLNLAFKSST